MKFCGFCPPSGGEPLGGMPCLRHGISQGFIGVLILLCILKIVRTHFAAFGGGGQDSEKLIGKSES